MRYEDPHKHAVGTPGNEKRTQKPPFAAGGQKKSLDGDIPNRESNTPRATLSDGKRTGLNRETRPNLEIRMQHSPPDVSFPYPFHPASRCSSTRLVRACIVEVIYAHPGPTLVYCGYGGCIGNLLILLRILARSWHSSPGQIHRISYWVLWPFGCGNGVW